MIRLAQKKKNRLHCAQDGKKKMGGISLRRFRKSLSSAAMVQKRLEKSTRLLNDTKNYGKWFLILSGEKTFTVDAVLKKQNDRVVSLGNNVCEHRRV